MNCITRIGESNGRAFVVYLSDGRKVVVERDGKGAAWLKVERQLVINPAHTEIASGYAPFIGPFMYDEDGRHSHIEDRDGKVILDVMPGCYCDQRGPVGRRIAELMTRDHTTL